MDYLDFEIEVTSINEQEYSVVVIHSPAGEAHESLILPFDEHSLKKRLQSLKIALLRSGGKHRLALSPEGQTVQVFGQELFEMLFKGEVRSRYDVSRREANGQGKGLRLKLRVQSPELAALPWEFLYDPRQAEYICLSLNTPVIRYLEIPQPIQPLNVTPPLRVLGMIASPEDLPKLNVQREKQQVEESVRDLQLKKWIELVWLDGQTWRDLQRAMRRGPWHVFHFIGHGGFNRNTDEGFIAFSDEEDKTYYLSATQLGRLLTDHNPMRLALLNACEGARGSDRDIFSSTASILVRRGLPAVLAMQYEITDNAAIEFSRVFYEAIADKMPVDKAVTEARKAISLAVVDTLEWGTPVLYTRAPDGVIFNIQSQEVIAQQQEETILVAEKELLAREAVDQPKPDLSEIALDQTVRTEVLKTIEETSIKINRGMYGGSSVADNNSRAVWRNLFSKFKGREIPELCAILKESQLDDPSRWKAITLLKYSVCTPEGKLFAPQALDAFCDNLRYAGYVHTESLAAITQTPIIPREKWSRLYNLLLTENLSIVNKIIKPLVSFTPPEERERTGAALLEIYYVSSTNTIVEAIRALNYRQGIPQLRDLIPTSDVSQSVLLAKLLADWGDKESVNSIRQAIEIHRYSGSSTFVGLLEALHILEGTECASYIVQIFNEGDLQLQKHMINSFLVRLLKEAIVRETIENLVKTTDNSELKKAAEALLSKKV